jgi:flagellar L-ring protein precursor FlgH
MNTPLTTARAARRAARRTAARQAVRAVAIGALVLALPACNTFDRLSNVGDGPSLAAIKDPQAQPGYKPVSMPMPTPQPSQRNPNSLWRNGARAFFKDQRAAQVGDLLTVTVAIADNATVNSTLAQTQGTPSSPNGESVGLPNLANYIGAGAFASAFGSVANAGALGSTASSSQVNNSGAITRNEAINLRLAAVVIQILPNGNLVIEGKQQVKVNAEMRELTISGIVRPEDIDSTNQISYEKIAEARISYGGQGTVSDVQSPRYGQQLLDILLPF